jgi:hypothetical protein
MKIMNGNLGKPWQLIHFVSSRPDHFFHSELLFGLHEFPVDADGHIGIDAAKENLRGVDRVVPVKFENNLEFRLRWSIIEGRQEGSSLLFVVRNNVLVHDRSNNLDGRDAIATQTERSAPTFQSLSPPERQLRKGEISPGACFLVTVEHVHIHTVPTIRFNDGLALT